MVFVWHFAIALIFTMGFYLGATYSSLHDAIQELKMLKSKIDLLSDDEEILFYKNRYNKAVADFNNRKKSIFAIAAMRLFKSLNQNFIPKP